MKTPTLIASLFPKERATAIVALLKPEGNQVTQEQIERYLEKIKTDPFEAPSTPEELQNYEAIKQLLERINKGETFEISTDKGIKIHTWKEQENEHAPRLDPSDNAYLVNVGQDDCSLLVVAPLPLSREEVIEALIAEDITLWLPAAEVEVEDYC